MSDTLFTFLLILAASFIFSAGLSKIPLLRIPSTVAYLIFGMLLHTGVVQLAPAEVTWLNHLADFGLLFLMYISGMEVDVRQLRPKAWQQGQKNPLRAAFTMFCATLLLSYGCAVALTHLTPHPNNPYFLALLFSTTSLGVIMPILEEAGLLDSHFGQTLLVSALVADFVTMLLLSVFIGSQSSASSWQLLMTLAIIPFIGLVYICLQTLRKLPTIRRLMGDAQTRTRAVLALLGVTCALADFTGAEPILGSFLVGMLVSALPFGFKNTLKDYSHGIGYGFFIPLFFISVGLDFDFSTVTSMNSLVWIGIISLIAFFVKIVPALFLKAQYGLQTALASGFLLSARLSLIAAAAQIGAQMHLVSARFADYVILVGVLTSLLSPIAFLTMLPAKIRARFAH